MKVILFGGAFDPPHLGHQQMTAEILKKGLADEIWYVPTRIHNFAKSVTAAKHRVAMLNFILIPQTRIESCELNRPGISYSYVTLNELSQRYPNDQLSWLIGSDNLAKFHLWKDYQKILNNYQVYVYPRLGIAIEPLYPGMIPLNKVKEMAFSSTEIRERLKNQQKVDQMLDQKVAAYIKKHHLYQIK